MWYCVCMRVRVCCVCYGCEYEIILWSVSYTHLDVYKRQVSTDNSVVSSVYL